MFEFLFTKLALSILIGIIITIMITAIFFMDDNYTVKIILKKMLFCFIATTVVCYVVFQMLV